MKYVKMIIQKLNNVSGGAGTAYPSEAPDFTPGFSGVHVVRSFVFCVMFCRSLFVFRIRKSFAIGTHRHWRCELESRSNEVYSIQNYVIKIISDLRQVGGFLRVLWFPPLIKQDRQI